MNRVDDPIYTLGYQGHTTETFLRKLRQAKVELLLDVRRNAVSRKQGFSKGLLRDLCQSNGIGYIHLRELGVPSSFRKSLRGPEDYAKVLDYYERKLLPEASDARHQAVKLVKEKCTVLLCFEQDANCCHRARLAEAISSETGMRVVHLQP